MKILQRQNTELIKCIKLHFISPEVLNAFCFFPTFFPAFSLFSRLFYRLFPRHFSRLFFDFLPDFFLDFFPDFFLDFFLDFFPDFFLDVLWKAADPKLVTASDFLNFKCFCHFGFVLIP